MGYLRTSEGKKMKALSEQRSASDKRRQKNESLSEHGSPSDKGRQKDEGSVLTKVCFGQEKVKK